MIEGVIYRYKSPSGKYYIGQTINEEKRRYNFLYDTSYAGYKINRARKKYGPENFEYSVLMKVTGDNSDEVFQYLNILEQYFIKVYDSVKNGYNGSTGGKNGLLSEEAKIKMSISRTGHKHSEESKKKMSISRKGIIFSEETKKKMSESRKGVEPGNKGKKMTDEQRKRVSEGSKKRSSDPQWREKIRNIHKGKPSPRKGVELSEETKMKLSKYFTGKHWKLVDGKRVWY